jgi:multidrug resistance efflux pump
LPERPAAPRRQTSWLPWSLCALLVALVAYLLVNRPEADEKKASENDLSTESVKSPSPGRTPAAGEVVLESKGYIMATHLYKVGPNQVGSKIKKLHPRFLEGQWISEGEVLAKLDDTEYSAKYAQAIGDYEQCRHEVKAARERLDAARCNPREERSQARAELEEARATLVKLQLDLDRNSGLKNGGALAKRDYEESKYSCDAQAHRVKMLEMKWRIMQRGSRKEMQAEAQYNLDKAKANLERAEAARKEAKWRLDNCTIEAPIPGTILKRYVELDDPLDARAFNLASILCDMADLRDLEVELTIQEREIARIDEGQNCLVRPETYPDKTFQGVVSRKMPNADRSKGAIPVRVKVLDIPNNNQDKFLVPDGGAIVTFLATPEKTRLENLRRLPRQAATAKLTLPAPDKKN